MTQKYKYRPSKSKLIRHTYITDGINSGSHYVKFLIQMQGFPNLSLKESLHWDNITQEFQR